MRKVKPFIPANSSELQEKFIRSLMLRGKLSTARKIWKNTLVEVSKKGSKDPVAVFDKAIENVKPSMEVRPKRVGGGVYQVPIEVKTGRQLSLAFKWILITARNGKGQPMYVKLAHALLEASEGQGQAVKKKEDVHKMAQANKAFAHLAKF